MLIFSGELIFQIPLDTWSIKIMWITAWIAILAGSVSLYKQLQGIGRKAAGLWIAATVFGILGTPFEILDSLAQGFSGVMENQGEMEMIPGFVVLQSVLGWGVSLGFLMYLAGTVLFLLFPPFVKMKSGWIWLLVAFGMSLFDFLPQFSFLPQFIGFYLIITRLYETEQLRMRAGALLWMSAGLLFSLVILLNNDLKYILVSALGLIFWLIGVRKLRLAGYTARGSGAFLWYGGLMLIASLFHILSGLIGDLLSFLFQLPACILLAVGFFRFSKTSAFYGNANGVSALGGITLFVLFLSIVYLVPVVGEAFSALGICLVVVPVLVVNWKDALCAVQEEMIAYSEEGKVLKLGSVIGRYKFAVILAVVLLAVAGAGYRIAAKTLPEKWLAEAHEIAIQQGHWDKISDGEISDVASLVRKAVWVGNAEAEMYCLKNAAQLDEIYRKAQWGDAYAQYAIGHFLRWPATIIDGVAIRERAVSGTDGLGSWKYLGETGKGRESEAEKCWDWYYKHNPKQRRWDRELVITPDEYNWMLKAADQGHPRALDIMEVYKDQFDWHWEAANNGSGVAQYYLGLAYEFGAKEIQGTDTALAYSWYMKSAQNDCTMAQVKVGIYLYYGFLDQERDPEEAFRWLKKAAGKGCKEAYFRLGFIYLDGAMTDYAKALECFQKSGNKPGENYCLGMCYELGVNGYKQDYDQAVNLYAEGGYEGMMRLGSYVYGEKKEAAIALLEKAAEKGNIIAFARLGDIYYNDENYDKAVPWLQKAAEQQDLNAMTQLGICYYWGLGIKKDTLKAINYLQKAADEGNAWAQYWIGRLWINMQNDYNQAFKWLKKSAEQGYSLAAYQVGICYRDGKGVYQNREEAKRWLQIADTDEAREALKKL